MAVTTQNANVAALMQKAIDRQAALARARFKLEPKQIQQIVLNYLQKNNLKQYEELVSAIRNWPISDDNLTVLLEDSINSVFLFSIETHSLVECVCNINWINKRPEFVDLYSQWILDLLTAHIYHAPTVMASLLKQFKHDGDIWESHDPPEEISFSWSYIHTILAKIIQIIPMSSEILLEKAIEQFPYYKMSNYINRSYVHNLIWITKYVPSLREQLITLIINRMIIMDVNISDILPKIKSETEIFLIDIDVKSKNNVADSLDYCMLEMLQWLQDERNNALSVICSVFEKVLLPTYGTRHVQFLLLYTISISQQCADRVLENLWTVTAGLHYLGPGALGTRRTAASHLAGLLARCQRLPKTRLLDYLKRAAEWCHSYITATQESTSAPTDNIKVHGAFNSICHAIFYLVGFKYNFLFANKEGIAFVESLNLPRIVTCSLNPLRTCPPQVTRAFSSVTRAHQVVYCQAVIERNVRQTLAWSTQEQYDHWFPYDPYTLPRSGKTIWPLCAEYKEWPNDDASSSKLIENKCKKMETDDDDFLATSPHDRIASLSNCISPGFKFNI